MLEGVSLIAELENAGVKFDFSGTNSLKVKCCFHEDTSPSAVFSMSTLRFKCYACDAQGDIVDFLARYLGRGRNDILLLLSERYGLTKSLRPIHADRIEEAHAAIWSDEATHLRNELHKRCVDDELIRRYRLGFSKTDGRIQIPILDPSGSAYINIRGYLPGAPGSEKMRNLRGRSKLAIYPQDQLVYDTMVFTGGEMKAVAAAGVLNRHDIGAVAITGGEGEWDTELNVHIAGKNIIVIMDIDDKGVKAAKKIARAFTPIAKSVKIVQLPLNRHAHPKGDVNDYLALGGDLYACVQAAEEYDPRILRVDWDSGEYIDRTISAAIKADNVGSRSRISCLVNGVAEQRFSIPKAVQVCCARDSKMCGGCPVAILDRDLFAIPSESPNVIAMLDASDDILRRVIDKELQIPSKCDVHEYTVTERSGAEVVVIAPPLELKASSTDDRESQKAIVLGDGVLPNEEYYLSGRAQPDPKTQEVVFLVSGVEKKTSSLSGYVFAHDDVCSIFQPPDWSIDALELHISDIYDGLSSITGIRMRNDLHLAIDLAYHSPLYIKPAYTTEKGWVEVLVIGDSSQGKTQATLSLQRHYGLGHKVDSKNASVPGLIGGLQKLGGMWMITWGALPTHDQRLVILEELKGAKTEVIAALTDVRSSGLASLEKIRSGRRKARTRLVALSNPRSTRPMNSYGHGVEAILELIGAPEDVRRFDFCICVAKDDLQTDVIHTLHAIRRNNPYTSEACHHNIMWAWTRSPEQVVFPEATWAAILEASKRLCKIYTEQIPIVDAGSMRYKVARLAASLAARTYSTDDNVNLLVRECHVEFIERFLMRTYNAPNMRYDTYSQRQNRLLNVVDEDSLISEIRSTPYARGLVEYLHGASWIAVEELAAHAGLTIGDAEVFMGALARNYAVSQKGRSYVASSGFRKLLDRLVTEKFDDRF